MKRARIEFQVSDIEYKVQQILDMYQEDRQRMYRMEMSNCESSAAPAAISSSGNRLGRRSPPNMLPLKPILVDRGHCNSTCDILSPEQQKDQQQQQQQQTAKKHVTLQ